MKDFYYVIAVVENCDINHYLGRSGPATIDSPDTLVFEDCAEAKAYMNQYGLGNVVLQISRDFLDVAALPY